MFPDPKDSSLLSSLSDEELVLLSAGGFIEQPAAELLRRYGSRLYRFAIWQCDQSTRLAEHMALRTWEQFLRHVIGHGNPEDSPRVLMFRIAHNQWQDVLRRQSGLSSAMQTGPERGAPPLAQALLGLPANLREPVLLHFMCDLTLAEISHVSGQDISTLTDRLNEALSELDIKLAPFQGDSDVRPPDRASIADQLKTVSLFSERATEGGTDQLPPAVSESRRPLRADTEIWRHFTRINNRFDAGQRDRRQKLSARIRRGQSPSAAMALAVSAACADWLQQQARADYRPLQRLFGWHNLRWVISGVILGALLTRFYVRQQPSDIETLMLQTFREVAAESAGVIPVRQVSHNHGMPNSAASRSSILAFILLAHLAEPPESVARKLPHGPNTHYRIFCSDPDDHKTREWIDQFRHLMKTQDNSAGLEILVAHDLQHGTLRIIALSSPTR